MRWRHPPEEGKWHKHQQIHKDAGTSCIDTMPAVVDEHNIIEIGIGKKPEVTACDAHFTYRTTKVLAGQTMCNLMHSSEGPFHNQKNDREGSNCTNSCAG